MYFKGDIIITDPCYIMINRQKDYESLPDLNKIRTCTYQENPELCLRETEKYQLAVKEWEKNNPDDWENCDYGSNMEELGFTTYLTRDTEYGDWSCTTYSKDTDQRLGGFCADAGLVSVFLLDEILKYNPEYSDHLSDRSLATWIKDFDGDVSIISGENGVQVIGTGNIDFYTIQTGY